MQELFTMLPAVSEAARLRCGLAAISLSSCKCPISAAVREPLHALGRGPAPVLAQQQLLLPPHSCNCKHMVVHACRTPNEPVRSGTTAAAAPRAATTLLQLISWLPGFLGRGVIVHLPSTSCLAPSALEPAAAAAGPTWAILSICPAGPVLPHQPESQQQQRQGRHGRYCPSAQLPRL